MGGHGGCRVGEVQAGTTSPMPDHKGFKLQELVNFQKFSTLRVNLPAFIYRLLICEDFSSVVRINMKSLCVRLSVEHSTTCDSRA